MAFYALGLFVAATLGFWLGILAGASRRAMLKAQVEQAYARGQHDLMQDTGFREGLRRRAQLVCDMDAAQGRQTDESVRQLSRSAGSRGAL